MSRISLSLSRLSCLAVITSVLSGCGNPTGLGSPIFANAIDTTTLFSLRRSPVPSPSAYDIVAAAPTRLELGMQYDFAFDFDSANVATILSAQLLGTLVESGLRSTKTPFDLITRAPLYGYVQDSLMTVAVDDVFLAQSRRVRDNCGFIGAFPRYGKFRVIAIDVQAGTITLETLVNRNCGFRDLEPGIPVK